uniref:G domain-containing protein n=1 Tax=Amphimedon queenslandica TaxID=400682 RepID=A0A1X7UCK9_AMPQE
MAEGLGEDLSDSQRSEIVVNEELDREVQPRPENLTIFVIGRTGTGKSTLINSLLELKEENQAKVAHGMYPCQHKMLEKHEGFFCGVPTTFYDSRGLGDPGFDNAVFLKKFDKAVKEHGDRYLVFICQRFEDRLDDSVHRFGELMARKFRRNYEIWKKSILVLTKANKFTYSENNPGLQATAELVRPLPGCEITGNKTTGNETTGDETTGNGTTGDETTGDETTGDETTGDETTGNETTGDETTGDETTGNETIGDETTGDETNAKKTLEEIAKEEERLKMMINVKEWCVNFKSCLTNHGVPKEIIARMLVCPIGNRERTEIALFENWKEELMEICIEAEKDWDIYRQRTLKSSREAVLPIVGPPIRMAIGTLLAEKKIIEYEGKKAEDESLDFAAKEKKFSSFFKRILNRR